MEDSAIRVGNWSISENLLPPNRTRRQIFTSLSTAEKDATLSGIARRVLEEFARYGNFHIPQSLNADEGWQIVEAILDSDNEAVQLALSYSLMYMCPDILFGNINSRLALADAPGAFELYMWIVQELDLSKNKSLVPLYENALKSDDPVVVSLTISYLCSVADHVSEDARNAIWDIWKREQNATPVWLAARSFLFPDYRSRAAGPRLGLQRLQRH